MPEHCLAIVTRIRDMRLVTGQWASVIQTSARTYLAERETIPGPGTRG